MGWISFNEVGEMTVIQDNINTKQYIDIFWDNLSNHALKLRILIPNYSQQDNDPKYIAYIRKLWLLYNLENQFQISPQSRDFNSVEKVWHIMNIKIRKKKFSKKSESKQALREE